MLYIISIETYLRNVINTKTENASLYNVRQHDTPNAVRFMALRSTTSLRTLANSIYTWVLLAGDISYVRWDLVMPPHSQNKTTADNIFSAHSGAVAKSFSIGGAYSMGSSLSAGSLGRNECNLRLETPAQS